MQSLLQLFSVPLRQRLATLPKHVMQELQEIRVRELRPLEIAWGRSYGFVSRQSGLCEDPAAAYLPTREDCAALLEMLTMHSLYTFEEELRRGYITVTGGHRVGLAGRTVLEHGKVKHLKDITGFNIRIAKEHRGAAVKVLPYLLDQQQEHRAIHHTLVVSPPQQGKTTLIRDLARIVSNGPAIREGSFMHRGYKVGIVDERSEIAACVKGVPRFELGPRTDVLDACPKAEGMMMLIRSMSPEVLIVDEIGRSEDAAAIHEAVHAGIRVIATAHGMDYTDVIKRPVLHEMLAEGVFSRIVVLGNRNGVGTLLGVYDAHGCPVLLKSELLTPAGSVQASWKEERGSPPPPVAIDWTGNHTLLQGQLLSKKQEPLC
ncbi:stage III sporulation protein AA [Paenibacillus radicis (ex Xue et al. 2023)]|uniref:Stage III sporulation protein AA n=1 Tax=Paenibacillus radicis (ex Xue et al. 2023) TaxID=2972489 RepID=A0ABT1YNJ4_9BACL|nr:stage III sporulation protein AA [Paenibacillus radicis (ex Xue et al. 2023)]MCR8633959.1 stage III sporulation protein AA [Paenibacillus radicis (ex Xue et al. 2023)]